MNFMIIMFQETYDNEKGKHQVVQGVGILKVDAPIELLKLIALGNKDERKTIIPVHTFINDEFWEFPIVQNAMIEMIMKHEAKLLKGKLEPLWCSHNKKNQSNC